MVTPELTKYIRTCIARNIPREQIIDSLAKAGWQQDDIAEGFASPTGPSASSVSSGSASSPSMSAPGVRMTSAYNGMSSSQTTRQTAATSAYSPHKKKSRFTTWLSVLLIILILAGGAWYAIQNIPVVHEVTTAIFNQLFNSEKTSGTPTLQDADAPHEAYGEYTHSLSQTETTLLHNFVQTYLSEPVSVPVEIVTILENNSDIPGQYRRASSAKTYTCPSMDECEYTAPTELSEFMFAYTVNQIQNNISDARNSAEMIITVGQQITEAPAPSGILRQLVGWEIQLLGYKALKVAREQFPSDPITRKDKDDIIKTLRRDHKVALENEFIFLAEVVSYITDQRYTFSNPETNLADNIDIQEFIAKIQPHMDTWNPDEVKDWIHRSAEISYANAAASCGSELPDSKLALYFDPADTSRHNYAGAYFYDTYYTTIDKSSVELRCSIESIIGSL